MPPQASDLGLRHLLHALADGAARHLQPGDHRRLMGLGMGAQLRPGGRQQLRHVVQIGLEGIEVDQQGGGIDLVLAHAGAGWRWLQHGVSNSPWPAHGRRVPAGAIQVWAAVLPFAVGTTTRFRRYAGPSYAASRANTRDGTSITAPVTQPARSRRSVG